MKTLKIITAIFLIALISLNNAFATDTYDKLKSEYNSSENLDYYKHNLKISTAGISKPKANEELKEVEKLISLAEKWSETVRKDKAPIFYTPNAENIAKAKRASLDDTKAQALTQALLQEDVSLDLLIAIALYKNPMIMSAKNKWKAAIERFSQVSNLDLIMQDYVSFTQSLSTKVGPQRNKKMIQMKFPFPGMLSLKGEIVTKDVQIAKSAYEDAKIKVITMLKRAYHHLKFIKREEQFTIKTLRLLRELEKVALVKYETGKTSFNDVIKVQIKIEKLADSLKTIKEKEANVKVKITQALNLPPTADFGELAETKVTFNKELEELYETGEKNSLELIMTRDKIKRMALMIDMAEKKFYPDFSASYSYFMDNKIMQTTSQAMMDTFMTRPATSISKNSFYAKNDAYIREVKESLKAMKQMLKAKQNKLNFNIKDTYFKIDTAFREKKLYETNLIPKANEALSVARTGYETGRVSFLDTLDAEMMWLNFHLKHFKAIHDIGMNIAIMERLTSTTLASYN